MGAKDDERRKEELKKESPEDRLARLKGRQSWQSQSVEPEDGPANSGMGPR